MLVAGETAVVLWSYRGGGTSGNMAARSSRLVCCVVIMSVIGMSRCKEKFNQNMGKGKSC